MREKLELKILSLVVALLLIGIISAGFMVMVVEKRSLYNLTETSSELAANIIAKNVERTMLEGRADVTKTVVDEIKAVSGLEDLLVLNFEGREAFNKDAPAREAEVLKKIVATNKPVSIRDKTMITLYKPLENTARCRECHLNEPAVMGAVKISFSIAKAYDRSMKLIMIVILLTIFASSCFSVILWLMIRRMIISPIKSLEKASQELSRGDLSFGIDIKSKDEIGRFSRSIKDSLLSVSGILKRIKEVTKRITYVAEEVGSEAKKVVDGAAIENDAIENISASIEEMNVSISEIAGGTEGLAVSAEQTAASMEQMVTSIAQIDGSAQDLSAAVETTSASVEQLSATIREVASNSSELAGVAQETQSAIIEIASSVREVEQRAKESSMLRIPLSPTWPT